MGLNTKRYMKQDFTPRQESVVVESLRQWFDDLPEDQAPEWVIRGLTAVELARANEAGKRQKNMSAAVEAVAGVMSSEKIEATRELLGIKAEETPEDIAKRLEMLVAGSVEPVIELDFAVKLAETKPIEFMLITNKITILTGKGAVPGKPKPSGQTPK